MAELRTLLGNMFAVEHGANVYTVQRIVGHFEALDHARRARRAVGRLTGATRGESWMQRSGPSLRRPLRAPMFRDPSEGLRLDAGVDLRRTRKILRAAAQYVVSERQADHQDNHK